jgi:hypothetical protein
VVYETFDGKAKSKDFIKDVTVTDDDVTFEWLPRNALFLNTGRLRVKLTAVVKDDMEVKQSWNTEPVILKISETLPDYEINDDQNGESVYYISVNDLITQEEGDALIDRVYEEAVEGIS